jgi:hypothetical protein
MKEAATIEYSRKRIFERINGAELEVSHNGQGIQIFLQIL